MKVQIYFSTPTNIFWWPLSWAIRFIESKDRPRLWHSSHAAIRVGDFVYEAVLFLGVRKINRWDWLIKNNINHRIELDVPNQKLGEFIAFMEGSIGVPYSTMELLGILYCRFMLKFFNTAVKNPFNLLKRKVKCTEFVLESVKKFIEINQSEDINNVGVPDLEIIIETEKRKIQIAKTLNNS